MKKLLLFAALFTATVMNLQAEDITSWTIAGDQAMMGTNWEPKDTNNDMTVFGGSYQLKKFAYLTEGGYDYKACANHAWGIKAIPSSTNQTLQIDDDGDYIVTFTLDMAGTTLSAKAERNTYSGPFVDTYVNDKSMGSVTGGGVYKKNDQVTLTAVPNAGYKFVNWSGDQTSTTNPLSFTASAVYTAVQANFEAETPTTPDMHDMLYFTSRKADGTGTVKLNKNASGKNSKPSNLTATFEYSKDRINWTAYDTWAASPLADQKTYQGAAIALNQGDTVFFRALGAKKDGKNTTSMYYDMSTYYNFAFGADDSIAAGGNIMSLYDATCEQDTMPAYGFYNLFQNAKQLVSAPKLPAKKLADYCYFGMFQSCKALTQAPALPATTLAPNCYGSMFNNCFSLTQAPELKADTLAEGCYGRMFSGDTSLIQAPELKATTLAGACYTQMFANCFSLTQAPELPATTLAESCYSNMFMKCTALTQAPELPADTLAKGCYKYMFQNCTSLTQAPELKATKLDSACYNGMFNGCTKLEVNTFSLICDGAELVVPDTTAAPKDWNKDMFKDCHVNDSAKLGGHYCIREYGKPLPPDMHDYFYLVGLNGNDTVHLDKMRAETPSTFEYSMDRKTWTAYDTWTTVSQTRKKGNPIALNQGDTVFFRAKGTNGKNATVGTNNAYFTFFFGKDDSIAVGGNIMSLYDATCEQDTMTEYGFYWLFYQNKNLVSAADLKLPAKKLAKNCYESMFDYCTALTDAPTISAETAAKYSCYYMFRGCTSLTTAPALPATKMAENCYQQMFYGCTALTQVPEMKADSLAKLCYYGMFSGCTSLQVDTCADGSCDGVKFNPTTVGTEPASWGSKMFEGCKGTVTKPQLNGHYCVKEYIAPYTRNVTKGNYGTICLDKKFNAMEGVEGLYVPSYKDASKLYCAEVKLSDVVAGGAYIFKADSAVIVLTLDGEAVTAAVDNDHMIGWLAADSTLSATFVSDHAGYALLASNQIVSPQSGSQILKNRAFIDLANVSTNPPSAAGRYIALGINEATGLENGECTAKGLMQNAECKMLINGQLIIIKDGVKYNAMGQKME